MLSCNDVWAIVNRWHVEVQVTRLRNSDLLAWVGMQAKWLLT